MIPALRIWHRKEAAKPAVHDITNPVWFTKTAPLSSANPLGRGIGIRPIVPRASFIAVVMVPSDLEECVALNGMPLWSGLHGLRHADRLDISGHNIWVAANTIETTAFDPVGCGDWEA